MSNTKANSIIKDSVVFDNNEESKVIEIGDIISPFDNWTSRTQHGIIYARFGNLSRTRAIEIKVPGQQRTITGYEGPRQEVLRKFLAIEFLYENPKTKNPNYSEGRVMVLVPFSRNDEIGDAELILRYAKEYSQGNFYFNGALIHGRIGTAIVPSTEYKNSEDNGSSYNELIKKRRLVNQIVIFCDTQGIFPASIPSGKENKMSSYDLVNEKLGQIDGLPKPLSHFSGFVAIDSGSNMLDVIGLTTGYQMTNRGRLELRLAGFLRNSTMQSNVPCILIARNIAQIKQGGEEEESKRGLIGSVLRDIKGFRYREFFIEGELAFNNNPSFPGGVLVRIEITSIAPLGAEKVTGMDDMPDIMEAGDVTIVAEKDLFSDNTEQNEQNNSAINSEPNNNEMDFDDDIPF